MEQNINLTQKEIAQFETLVAAELAQQLGDEPTVESLQQLGYSEQTWLNEALDNISGAGRVTTLFVAEFAQAFAALALAIVFILLEAERISSGAQALGQQPAQAILIAIAFTVANAVLPLYRLRNVRGQTTLIRTRPTIRGYVEMFWRRLIFKPATYEVDVYDNPTLHLMESAVTWATIFMAIYAVLGPLMNKYVSEVWYTAIVDVVTKSNINEMIQLVAGGLLSIGGVFGVQSISHEFGVRTVVDRPQRLIDMLESRRTERQQQTIALRESLREQFIANVAAEREQRKLERKAKESERNASIPLEMWPTQIKANGRPDHAHDDE